jgi:hypothetical protein
MDFGLTELTEYREINLRLSQTTDRALYCSNFQFRLAAAVFLDGASDSSDLLCGPRMLSDVFTAQIRGFSMNPGETLQFQNLASNYLSELVRMRVVGSGDRAYFQTVAGGTFVVGRGNTSYFFEDELTQSGRLSFCPRPLDFQSVCSPGCAPGERLVAGVCERHTIRNIALAATSACALNPFGTVKCWGTRPLSPATEVGPFQALMGSGNETCGLNQEGQLRCWGQLSSTTTISSQIRWKSFAMANSRSCGVTVGGQILCFGVNSTIPPAIEDREDWDSVAVSDRDTCAVDVEGSMECWRNGNPRAHPFQDQKIQAVSGGKKHFCAKKTDKSLSCWGEATGPEATVPPDLGPIKSFSVGYQHNCAIDSNDRLKCWGANDSQQLDVPTNLESIRSVTAGTRSTCAVTEAGRITCWGNPASEIQNVHPDL